MNFFVQSQMNYNLGNPTLLEYLVVYNTKLSLMNLDSEKYNFAKILAFLI